MSDHLSRLNRHEKRRKNTKKLLILLIVGGLLVLFLLGFLIFGGSGHEEEANTAESGNQDVEIEETEEENEDEDVEVKEKEDEEENDADSEDESDEDELEKENAEPSDDNVRDAYTGNWEPVGTEQEGEHTTQFDKESKDWKEMERAASIAADLDQSNMVTWYIEGAGEEQTIATVSDEDDKNTYRVFLTWVDGEGWQPTKVEILKENDKK